MFKPKTKAPALLAPGYVTFQPISAPNVLLSNLRIDRGSGEQTINFARYQLARAMKQNNGTLSSGYLAELLDDIDKYYAPLPHPVVTFQRPVADDAVSILDISKSAIKNGAWEKCRILRLDSLLEEAKFIVFPGRSIAEHKLKAVNENNQAALAVLTQTEQYLTSLFRTNGVRYQRNIMQPLTLTMPRNVVDDTIEEQQQQQIEQPVFHEKFSGFAAFYKSSKKCDRVLIALCRNSIDSLVNLQVSLRNGRFAVLESRLKALEDRVDELDN